MAPDDTTPTTPIAAEGDADSAFALDVGDGPAEAAAPAPRKRATRKTVRKASADVLPGAQPELGTAEDSAPPPRAPRKRAPRKATAAAQAAPVELPIEPTHDEPAVAEPTAEEPAVLEPTAEEPVVLEPTAEEPAVLEPTVDEPSVDEPSVTASLSTFTVLFRPPDPTAAEPTPTRRRRATRPVLEVTGPELAGGEATGSAPEAGPLAASPEQEPLAGIDEPDPAEADAEEVAEGELPGRRARRRRGGKGRRARSVPVGQDAESYAGAPSPQQEPGPAPAETAAPGPLTSADGQSDGEPMDEPDEEGGPSRRRRRRRRAGVGDGGPGEEPGGRVREGRPQRDEPTAVRGSTRLEAKKQRRREGREAGRRRTVLTEAEFLARRESVDRVMVVRNKDGRTQMGVLEDGVLVEHYIDQATTVSMAGSIYLGRVQNVLPSMEAAFVDIGKGRNAVLYAGEVNWDAAGLEVGQSKRIENALEPGQTVLVQVTKDPIGHKGARLTSQISLPGRYLVYVPNSSMTGISRKLPDTERARLKKILREVVPDDAGVIVRTAAEGASEQELRADVERLTRTWEDIRARAEAASSAKAARSKGRKKNGGSAGPTAGGTAPLLLHGEPDLTVRVIRDVFNEDFKQLLVSGEQAWEEIHPYITSVAPDLADRVSRWTGTVDLFTQHRVDEQLAKAMDRKVWLPSGGSLVIDRTEAMTVIDVNTGKFIGAGGNLEETVTKNNIEAAEEIVRQLRLRDIGGIIVIDFIDMVLESNRELVVRRLLECLGRDRTKHQVAEVTSLGLVQMTRKRVGAGLIEVFSHTCEQCNGRGFLISAEPVGRGVEGEGQQAAGRSRRERRDGEAPGAGSAPVTEHPRPSTGPTAAQIAAAAHAAALKKGTAGESDEQPRDGGPAEAETAEARGEPEREGPVPAPSGDSQPVRATEQPAPSSDSQPVQATEQPAPSGDSQPVRATEQPAPARPRRRRGRVVAPAGPPRAAGGA